MKEVKKIMVEIIGNHPSLKIGSKGSYPLIVARGLIKNGMARLYVESEDEKAAAFKDVPDFKTETPKEKVTVVKVEQPKVDYVKKAEPMTTKSAVKVDNKKGKNKNKK